MAVTGTDGGPVRAVLRGDDGGRFWISARLDPSLEGEVVDLDGSDAADARPFAAAAGAGGDDTWLVVGGGGGESDAPLTVWSSVDAERPEGDRSPLAPAATLPDSDFGAGWFTTVATVAGDYQVVAAADPEQQIVIWGRRGAGPWRRSTIDPLESARSRPAPDPGFVRHLRIAPDGDRVVLAAISGDPKFLSLWASSSVREDGPVSWRHTADDLDGEPACYLAALHASAPGVLLGWSPLEQGRCMDQQEVRFGVLDPSGGTEQLPSLGPRTSGAVVYDAVTLADGTTIAVGSTDSPPRSATFDDEAAPVMWLSTSGQEWERVDDIPLAGQLDQRAATVSINGSAPSSSEDQISAADALQQVLVVTRPYGPYAPRTHPDGMALWTWEREDG